MIYVEFKTQLLSVAPRIHTLIIPLGAPMSKVLSLGAKYLYLFYFSRLHENEQIGDQESPIPFCLAYIF